MQTRNQLACRDSNDSEVLDSKEASYITTSKTGGTSRKEVPQETEKQAIGK